jgi:hypothetical protein
MAVKFRELYDNVYCTPLNQEELKQVDKIEKWIDEELRKRYKGGKEVSVDLSVASFRYDPVTKETFYGDKFPEPRRDLMRQELEKRYKNAGWKIKVELDDGLDGPNRSGPDYWVLPDLQLVLDVISFLL